MAEARRLGPVAAVALAMLLALAGARWLEDAPRLAVSPLVIESAGGQHRFEVELADTDETRARGLMFRTHLPEGRGMLFDYGEPRIGVAFWMKDTPIPLDIIFIAPDATILRIAARTQPYSEEPIPAGGITRAVLEVRGGVASRLGIEPGDRVLHPIFGNASP